MVLEVPGDVSVQEVRGPGVGEHAARQREVAIDDEVSDVGGSRDPLQRCYQNTYIYCLIGILKGCFLVARCKSWQL